MSVSPRSIAAAAFVILAAVSTACSKDPEQLKGEYAASGDRYFEEKQYSKAIIEYRNALQIDPKMGPARYKLAQSYEAIGDVPNAVREFIRAADALPNDAKAQWKGGTMLLLAGQFQEARTRAEKALKLDPKYADAQVLLGNALAGLKDFDAAIREIEEAIKLDPSSSAYSSLASLHQVKGSSEDAEAAFRRAVELDPKNPTVHMALSQFLWMSRRPAEAEKALQTALSLDPKNPPAHRAMASLLISSNRAAEAEPHLKALGESDTSSSQSLKLSLADYYVAMNRHQDALRVLEEIAKSQGAYSAARTRTALLDYATKGSTEGNKVIDDVLAKDPKNVPALLTKARFLMTENKLEEAEKRARAAVTADPGSLQAHFLLGTLYRLQGKNEEAARSFGEALKINPRATAAQVQLSQLSLAAGERDRALQLAQDAARRAPRDAIARLTLFNSLLANGELVAAERELAPLAASFPRNSSVLVATGQLALAKGDRQAARAAFEKAGETAPADYEAFRGQLALDLVEKKFDEAKARIERQVAAPTKNARALSLGAGVYLRLGEQKRAEELLKLAVEQNPAEFDAYIMLAGIYRRQDRIQDARASLEAVIAKKPDAIGPHTMIGMLYEAEGNLPEAQRRYEQVIQIDSNAPVAANNLAYLYSEGGVNLDLALQLAQVARRQLPDADQVADTLGWIYVKKGLPTLAIPPLEEAVKKQPENATYLYHLGVALAESGDRPRSRQMLQRALTLKLPPADAEAAKRLASQL